LEICLASNESPCYPKYYGDTDYRPPRFHGFDIGFRWPDPPPELLAQLRPGETLAYDFYALDPEEFWEADCHTPEEFSATQPTEIAEEGCPPEITPVFLARVENPEATNCPWGETDAPGLRVFRSFNQALMTSVDHIWRPDFCSYLNRIPNFMLKVMAVDGEAERELTRCTKCTQLAECRGQFVHGPDCCWSDYADGLMAGAYGITVPECPDSRIAVALRTGGEEGRCDFFLYDPLPPEEGDFQLVLSWANLPCEDYISRTCEVGEAEPCLITGKWQLWVYAYDHIAGGYAGVDGIFDIDPDGGNPELPAGKVEGVLLPGLHTYFGCEEGEPMTLRIS
jgi:hypothetical protein